MSRRCCNIILSIFLGIAFMAVGAIAETPKEIKAPVDEEKEYLPEPDEFIKVEQPAEMMYEEVPVYPEPAKKAGLEAIVWIKSLIDKKGEVVKAFVLKSSGSKAGFDESALKAAYKCKFKPAVKDDKPLAVWITYCVQFTLSEEKTQEKATESLKKS